MKKHVEYIHVEYRIAIQVIISGLVCLECGIILNDSKKKRYDTSITKISYSL